jgi:hypothetical protein
MTIFLLFLEEFSCRKNVSGAPKQNVVSPEQTQILPSYAKHCLESVLERMHTCIKYWTLVDRIRGGCPVEERNSHRHTSRNFISISTDEYII